MRDFTTEEIIKIIPLSQEVRKELQDKWGSLDEEGKYLVGRVCWESFHEFRNRITQFVYSEYMAEVESGKRKLTETIMEDVDKEVEGIFTEMLAGKLEEREEISEIRSKLQNLINLKPDSKPN